MPFTLGQRWISDTESELGLGTVVALDARMITLLFPATGENRLYARNDSPITRVMFNPGDTVSSHEGWQLQVEEVKEENGLLTYIGTRLDTQESGVAMREVLLDSKLTFSKPQDRLFAGQIDRMDRFALRFRARKYQSEQYRLPFAGLRGMRASLIPHQLHIAHEVGQRHAPRVLLGGRSRPRQNHRSRHDHPPATAGGRAERVLIVVPETLQHQWLVEMMRPLQPLFLAVRRQPLRRSKLDSSNPFETEQLVICSLDFVRRNKQRLEELADAQWDLLVVDEAHHLAWSEEAPSREYQVIEQLAEHIPGVLLLTATPEQLGQQSHFARLRLLDPNRFHDYGEFVAEQQKYRPVADAVTLLLSGERLADDKLNLLGELIDEQDIEPLLKAANSEGDNAEQARQELVAMLMDRHGTSRVLFRNTRNGVKGFPHRNLHQIKLPLPTQYQTAIKVSGIMGAKKSVEARARDMLYPEQIYQEFEGENAPGGTSTRASSGCWITCWPTATKRCW
ncbi:RNA polymerase-associated protein rapA [Serratia marcescens]|uniref:RNA polymerase-associated protein rapA n=1 Tax=Serratia marcescens TaxID=615 RepID=A0A379Y0Y8_SERMA|nr:RNA polymerase-associated protein rapA [Serratia marcescens]